jgi:hypothetical protein
LDRSSSPLGSSPLPPLRLTVRPLLLTVLLKSRGRVAVCVRGALLDRIHPPTTTDFTADFTTDRGLSNKRRGRGAVCVRGALLYRIQPHHALHWPPSNPRQFLRL